MKTDVNRRLYLGALSATAVALVLFRTFAIPRWDGSKVKAIEVLSSVVDSLLGGTLAALAVSALVFWLYRSEERTADEAVVVGPREISNELKSAAEVTTEWNYRGHTGRYFRSSIMPLLESRTERHGRYITIRAQLLDPDDADRLRFFVHYRRSVNPEKELYWTEERARAEILATLVALVTAPSSSPRISCEVFVGGYVSPFTVDMASSVAVVTRESAALGALKYPLGSTFFDSMAEDLHLAREQARALPTISVVAGDIDTCDRLRSVLQLLGVAADATDDLLQMTLHALQHPINPYPNG